MSVLRPITWHTNSTLTGSAVIQAVLSDLDVENQSEMAEFLRNRQNVFTKYADAQVRRLEEERAAAEQKVSDDAETVDALPKPFRLKAVPTTFRQVPGALLEFVSYLIDEGPAQASGVRTNPPRFRVQPKYKRNPFLPKDQDPLILFAARCRSHKRIPVQPYECLRAARLLLAHTTGSNPDFDIKQIQALIGVIQAEMERLGQPFRATDPGQKYPFAEDYLIVLPEAGSYPWMGAGKNHGLISWAWSGGRTYTLRLPLLVDFNGVSIENLARRIAAKGKYCVYQVQPMGQYAVAEITAGTDTAQDWINEFSDAEQAAFALRLQAASRLWDILGWSPAQGRPGEYQLSPEECVELADYCDRHDVYSEIVASINSSRSSIEQKYVEFAAYNILKALTGSYYQVTGYPHGTRPEDAQAQPGEIALILPPGVLPFRFYKDQVNWQIFLGTGEYQDNHPTWFEKTSSHLPVPGSHWKKFDRDKRAPWTWPTYREGNSNRFYPAVDIYAGFVDGPLVIQDAIIPAFEVRAHSDSAKWFRTKAVGTYPLLHVALALRAAALNQLMNSAEEKEKDLLDLDLIGKLTTGSPAPGVRVGAGRIDAISLTSQFSGKTKIAEGLSPGDKEKIKLLIPGPSFKATKTVTLPSKAGGKAVTVKKVFRPLPYQQVGIAFIHATGCRAMIADEMGLGKTIQALGALAVDPSPVTGKRMLPALVICPSSVVVNWQNEVKAWLPHLSVGVWEKNGPSFDVSIVSWNRAGSNYMDLMGRFQTVIADEAHYGKRLYKIKSSDKRPTLEQILAGKAPQGNDSPYTTRTFGMVAITQSAPHAILLTGTPLENGGKDLDKLWTYLNTLDPLRFPDYKAFVDQYLTVRQKKKEAKGKASKGAKESHIGTDPRFDWASEEAQMIVEQVRTLLQRYVLRRLKSTVTEQINLGCMWFPDYGNSDAGCAGSAREIVTVEGQEETKGGSDDIETVMNRGHRPMVRYQPRKNTQSGEGAERGGYMRMGVTKTIEYRKLVLNKVQKDLIQSVNDNLRGVIAKEERNRRILEVVKTINKEGAADNDSRISFLVDSINEIKVDPASIEKVAIAVYHYFRVTTGIVKIQPTLDFIYQTVIKNREPLLVWFAQLNVVTAVENAINGVAEFTDPSGEVVKMSFAPFRVNGQPLKYAVVTGASSPIEKAEAVRKFQAGEIDLLLCSQALREGVTLTRATKALFVEFWWVPAWLMQAEDRIYRIGQTRDTQITYLVCPALPVEETNRAGLRVDQMDELMMRMLRKKRIISDVVLGGEEFLKTTSEGADDFEDDDTEDADDKATAKGVLSAVAGLSDAIKHATEDVEITFDEVVERLQKARGPQEVYSLTTQGQNPKWVEESFVILAPKEQWAQKLHQAKVEFTPADLRLLEFVYGLPDQTARYQDFLSLMGDDPNAVSARRKFHNTEEKEKKGKKGGVYDLFTIKDANYYIDRLRKVLADRKKGKKPGVLRIEGNDQMFGHTGEDQELRSFLNFMQERLQLRLKEGTPLASANKFLAPALMNQLKTAGLISGRFTLDHLSKAMKSLQDGERADRRGARNLVTVTKERPSKRNGGTSALSAGQIQRNRMSTMETEAKKLLSALNKKDPQDAVDIYADLCDRVEEAKATGFDVPRSVKVALERAYKSLSQR